MALFNPSLIENFSVQTKYAVSSQDKQPQSLLHSCRNQYTIEHMMNADPDNSERLLAIGDIHGCLDQLQELLRHVRPTHEDRVIFLGDYVDRGPDSASVIEFLIN
ncbi:MAG: hypothetical protein GTO60_13480, partial [Gammaproteobacteria bacterium]|nr:hypothetical protein [Gammaproteobacteria bacterium]